MGGLWAAAAFFHSRTPLAHLSLSFITWSGVIHSCVHCVPTAIERLLLLVPGESNAVPGEPFLSKPHPTLINTTDSNILLTQCEDTSTCNPHSMKILQHVINVV